MITVKFLNGKNKRFTDLSTMLKDASLFHLNLEAEPVTISCTEEARKIKQITIIREPLFGVFARVMTECANLEDLTLSWCVIANDEIRNLIGSAIVKHAMLRYIDLNGTPIDLENYRRYATFVRPVVSHVQDFFARVGEKCSSWLKICWSYFSKKPVFAATDLMPLSEVVAPQETANLLPIVHKGISAEDVMRKLRAQLRQQVRDVHPGGGLKKARANESREGFFMASSKTGFVSVQGVASRALGEV